MAGYTMVGSDARSYTDMQGRVAVLSDIHGNADMLNRGLKEVERAAPDVMVILGDLLTYGAQPQAVIDRIDECVRGPLPVVFIRGNHDEFYFKLETGVCEVFTKEPTFIRESVYWTENQLSAEVELAARYDWQDDYTFGPVYFAHANPFGYGDWRYVSDDASCDEAATALCALGCTIGVFGHSHRVMHTCVGPEGLTALEPRNWRILAPDECALLNPGSVGHPRGTGLSMLVLDIADSSLRADVRQLDPDFQAQRRAIKASAMSAATKNKLLSYYE